MRGLGIFLLALEIALMILYGLLTSVKNTFSTTTDNSAYLIMYLLPGILALLGWGLIIAYSENSAISGLTTTLATVGMTVQLQPPILVFWVYVFDHFAGNYAVSMVDELVVMFMMVSMMVALCGLSGRLSLLDTFLVIFGFNVGWPLCFNFISWLKTSKWAGELGNITDACGGGFTYLFAGVFALIVSFFINCKEGTRASFSGSRQSAFIGMIGTGFAFAASPFTSMVGLAGNTVPTFELALNCYFALTASVIFTYAFSAIFGNLKIGVRESLVGVLGGMAMISTVSAFINNIGAVITVGAFAGLVSGFWLRYVHPRINANKTIDHLGLIGPITINAFLGLGFVAPILYGAYKDIGITPAEITMTITNQRVSTYFLGVLGVTLLIAIGMGVITGLLVYLARDAGDDFHYGKLVSTDFGLYNEGAAAPQIEQPHNSASHLRQEP